MHESPTESRRGSRLTGVSSCPQATTTNPQTQWFRSQPSLTTIDADVHPHRALSATFAGLLAAVRPDVDRAHFRSYWPGRARMPYMIAPRVAGSIFSQRHVGDSLCPRRAAAAACAPAPAFLRAFPAAAFAWPRARSRRISICSVESPYNRRAFWRRRCYVVLGQLIG